MMLNPFRLLSRLYWTLYWFLNKPVTKSTPHGDANPEWVHYYMWKHRVSKEKALAAHSILTYRVNEPCPFKETRDWERWYREANEDKTFTRSDIKERLIRIHLTSKVASVGFEPSLLLDGDLNLKWVKWYRNLNGTTLFKAKIVGYQKMAEVGLFSQKAWDSFLNRPVPELTSAHWLDWWANRYRKTRKEAGVAFNIEKALRV